MKFRCSTCYMRFSEEESLQYHRNVCGINTPEFQERRLMKGQKKPRNEDQLNFKTGNVQKKIRTTRSDRRISVWETIVGSPSDGDANLGLGSSQLTPHQQRPKELDSKGIPPGTFGAVEDKESDPLIDKQQKKKDDMNLRSDQAYIERDEVLEAPKPKPKQVIEVDDYKNGVRFITEGGKKLNFIPSAWWFQCRICGRCIQDKDKFLEHKRTQHVKKIIEDKDDSDDESSSSARGHADTPGVGVLPFMSVANHGNTLNKYSCSKCSETFSFKAHLVCHKWIVHDPATVKKNEKGPQLLRCGEKGCGKLFRLRRQLASHVWVHTGERKPSKPTLST